MHPFHATRVFHFPAPFFFSSPSFDTFNKIVRKLETQKVKIKGKAVNQSFGQRMVKGDKRENAKGGTVY